MIGTVLAEVTLATVVNVTYAIQKGNDPFKPALASGVLAVMLVAVEQLIDDGVAVALGAIFLLGSFLFHGQLFIDLLIKLTS